MKVKTSRPAIRGDEPRIRCVDNVQLGEFRLLATLFRIPRRWSKKLVKDKGGWVAPRVEKTKREGESGGGRKVEKKGRREASKGDKKDGRELTGSQPSASPRQFRLQGFLLYGLCSGHRLGYRGGDATWGHQFGSDDGEPPGREWNRATTDRGYHDDPGGSFRGVARRGGGCGYGSCPTNTRGPHN